MTSRRISCPKVRARLGGAALALLASAVSCALLDPSGGGEQATHALAFDHATHAEADLACADCHAPAEAEQAGRMTLPELSFCLDCHEDEEDPPTRALLEGLAGRAEGARWVLYSPNPEVIFSHATHTQTACAECHGDVASLAATGPGVVPSMATCVDCHADQAPERNDCATCHRERRQDVAPESHRRDWTREHGVHARFGSLDTVLQGDCAHCHTRDSCLECHRQVPPRDHGHFFRIRGHGLMASNDRQSCASCHQPDSCVRCHETTPPLSHRGSWGAPRDQHCTNCHQPLQGEGCFLCHKTTPSHALATPRSPRHVPGLNCRQCHGTTASLPHADDGSDCTQCHR